MKITWKKHGTNNWRAFVADEYVGEIEREKNDSGRWRYVAYGRNGVELRRFGSLAEAKRTVRV